MRTAYLLGERQRLRKKAEVRLPRPVGTFYVRDRPAELTRGLESMTTVIAQEQNAVQYFIALDSH